MAFEKTDRWAPDGQECLGMIVRSAAGRDAGRVFMIVGTVPDAGYEDCVLIANGSLRTIGKPKRKKIRHLKVLGVADTQTVGSLLDGSLTDAQLRKAIRAWINDGFKNS